MILLKFSSPPQSDVSTQNSINVAVLGSHLHVSILFHQPRLSVCHAEGPGDANELDAVGPQ